MNWTPIGGKIAAELFWIHVIELPAVPSATRRPSTKRVRTGSTRTVTPGRIVRVTPGRTVTHEVTT
ncbi:MAG: hypothetical protein E6K18_08195 [Methanobacteriota archaeon]|nr:MAG: hypothetical protein E6K18_08195 [Euryarchaeota archaeon]